MSTPSQASALAAWRPGLRGSVSLTPWRCTCGWGPSLATPAPFVVAVWPLFFSPQSSMLGAGCGARQGRGSALPGAPDLLGPDASLPVVHTEVQAQRGARVMQGHAPPWVPPPVPPAAVGASMREAPSQCGLPGPPGRGDPVLGCFGLPEGQTDSSVCSDRSSAGVGHGPAHPGPVFPPCQPTWPVASTCGFTGAAEPPRPCGVRVFGFPA